RVWNSAVHGPVPDATAGGGVISSGGGVGNGAMDGTVPHPHKTERHNAASVSFFGDIGRDFLQEGFGVDDVVAFDLHILRDDLLGGAVLVDDMLDRLGDDLGLLRLFVPGHDAPGAPSAEREAQHKRGDVALPTRQNGQRGRENAFQKRAHQCSEASASRWMSPGPLMDTRAAARAVTTIPSSAIARMSAQP